MNGSFEGLLQTKGNFCVYLTAQRKCYVWGSSFNGELGLGDHNYRCIPTPLSISNEKISFITCGNNHTICLTESNSCYVWGDNKCGQLGLGNQKNRSVPTLLSLPCNQKITFITCGRDYTMCLTEKHLCYFWGNNNRGQLGLGDKESRFSPTLLTLPQKEEIFSVSLGDAHSMCLTQNSLCYVWGGNNNGELGLGDTKDRLLPTLLTLPNKEKILFITCGSYHTMCLTENNLCYTWGYNSCGQLGLGDKKDRHVPTLFSFIDSKSIFYLQCVWNRSICLTQNGVCHIWGHNRYIDSEFGLANTHSTPTLLKLPIDERISFITCGANHTICLTENNLIYVWGENGCGELGLGDKTNRCKPTLSGISFLI